MTQAESLLGEQHWQNVFGMIEQIGFSPDATQRAQDVSHMGPHDLIAAITLMHGVLAPNADQNPTDFTMKVSSPDEPADPGKELMKPEERFALIESATRLIHSLVGKMKPGYEQAFLNRAADIVALSTVMAHPFEDGNGRTARTLAGLIRFGFDGSDDARESIKALGTNRTFKGFRVRSYLPKNKRMNPLRVLKIAASLDLELSDSQETYLDRKHQTYASTY